MAHAPQERHFSPSGSEMSRACGRTEALGHENCPLVDWYRFKRFFIDRVLQLDENCEDLPVLESEKPEKGFHKTFEKYEACFQETRKNYLSSPDRDVGERHKEKGAEKYGDEDNDRRSRR